jgi:hypothetical protein
MLRYARRGRTRKRAVWDLPRQEQRFLRSHSESVTVEAREELNGVAKLIRHLYFPLTAAISLLYMDRSGRAVEAAVGALKDAPLRM